MAIILANILQSFLKSLLQGLTRLHFWSLEIILGEETLLDVGSSMVSPCCSPSPPSIHKLQPQPGRCSRTQQKQALGSKPILKHTYWCAPACVYKRSFHSRILYTLKIRKHNSKAILNATNSSFIWHKQSYEHGYQLFEPFKSQNNPDLFVLKDQIGPVLFPVNFTRWTP